MSISHCDTVLAGSAMRTGPRPAQTAWTDPVGRGLRRASPWMLAGTVGICPLLAGTVHRPAVVAVLLATLATFLCATVGQALEGRGLRGQQFSLFFLLLALLPMLQVVPFPSSWRGAIDPAGATLLSNGPAGLPRWWPLSLDPSSTLVEVGAAAATLMVFLLALHVAAGRRHRTLVLSAIAFAGVFGVVSGIAHRLFGIDRLYGLFDVVGAVIPGPFINPNHAAEFYELGTFAALALAMDSTAEIRMGWFAAAGLNAATALSTLSRGSMLALLVGGAVFVFLRVRAHRASEGEIAQPQRRFRTTLMWSLFALGCLAATAVALGAAPLVDEMARTNLMDGSEKIVVWRDSLPIVLRHPLGIGRHAFDRVFPAYKTLSLNTRFQFVENAPLQLLIDLGWAGLVLMGMAAVWTWRRSPIRRDDVGMALLAALAAVAAHNLVDFGIETLGIRFCAVAIAGVIIGRGYGRGVSPPRGLERSFRYVAPAVALLGVVAGLLAQLRMNADDLEKRWREAETPAERRSMAIRGGERYPTDYFFPLLQSYDEPLRLRTPEGASTSPKLASLNRALRLCPTCPFIHEHAAHALRVLGFRSQALSSYRDTVRLAPSRLPTVLGQLELDHYAPAQVATLAVGSGEMTLVVARHLLARKAEGEVRELIRLARQQGVPEADLLLVQAELAIALGRPKDAERSLEEMSRVAPRDGRLYATRARMAEQQKHPEQALEQARMAATMSPFSVEFARLRVGLVLQLQRWSEMDEALDHLKIALRQSGQNITEVHMLAGQTHEARGNLERALSEFRTAAILDGTNPATWAAVARVSEGRGDLNGAAEAYQRVIRIRPDDQIAQQSLARIEKESSAARLRQLLP